MKSKMLSVNQAYALILQDESQKMTASGSYMTHEGDLQPSSLHVLQEWKVRRKIGILYVIFVMSKDIPKQIVKNYRNVTIVERQDT